MNRLESNDVYLHNGSEVHPENKISEFGGLPRVVGEGGSSRELLAGSRDSVRSAQTIVSFLLQIISPPRITCLVELADLKQIEA